jgi:3-hydroxyacyl-[acyl-carrier-protein] dehydratase
MGLIGLKYCGGCNPVIDRAALVQEVERLLPEGWTLITEGQADPWQRALLVCGCPVACADRAEVRGLAGQWILISGAMVDREMVPEDHLATVIIGKIKSPGI